MFGEVEGRKNKNKEVTQKNKEGSPNPLIKLPKWVPETQQSHNRKIKGSDFIRVDKDI